MLLFYLNLEKTMLVRFFIMNLVFSALAFGEYNYSLEDINSSSEDFGELVGTSYFEGQVTLHYFGHYN